MDWIVLAWWYSVVGSVERAGSPRYIQHCGPSVKADAEGEEREEARETED